MGSETTLRKGRRHSRAAARSVVSDPTPKKGRRHSRAAARSVVSDPTPRRHSRAAARSVVSDPTPTLRQKGRGQARAAARSVLPDPWLQTLRLDLREFVPGDVEDLVRLNADPRVMKYIGDGRVHTREETHRTFPRVVRYPRLYADLGAWYATRRDTGAFIGWFSLKYAGKASDIEIGYRLLPDAWGQGFATEGAAAMRDYGFDDVGLARIIGITHPGNRASQHVLTKIGMVDEGWGDYYDQRLRLFAIYAAE